MSSPQTIAHYRITGKLGEGGMGAVYRATDTKLGREVAIKVLPDAFAQDADRMARFTREAQVLASLNHPNIAAIYGVEQGALVMELVEGEELKGPLPAATAILYARQIALALEAAHEKGIIHRDLKPANVKVTAEGVVKVLDFGLAKAGDATPSAVSGAPTMSPTMSLAMTQAGVILGTAAYMSPEQARGKPVDKRADIFAFGVVLYEMLAGSVLFGGGETVSDALAAVITKEPDWRALPKETPAHVRRLLERCLRKDPRMRLRDIGDARMALDEPDAEPDPGGTDDRPLSSVTRRASLWPVWAALLAIVSAVALAGWWRVMWPPGLPMMRFSAELGADAVAGSRTTAVISPDGTRLVFPVRAAGGTTQLATRLLDQSKSNILAGTEEAADPFFKPDGQWIGFFDGNKMKKISVQGGAAVTLCEATIPRGAAWGEDGNIIAALDALHLSRVPEAGGTPQILFKPEAHGERTYRWPQILPGGQAVLVTASGVTAGGGYEDANVEVLSLKTGQPKIVQRGGYFGRYLPSGHLVYVHQGTLFGVPFDLARLETRGMPAPVLDDVAGVVNQGSGQLDFSQTGTFVYLSGKSGSTVAWPIAWMDSAGKTQPLVTTPTFTNTPRLSPDGKRLALTMLGDLFVYDPQRNAMPRLTFNNSFNRYPVWTPDGKHILFGSGAIANGEFGIWWIRADGSAPPQPLFSTKEDVRPNSLSPDGRRLAFSQVSAHSAIWTLPLDTSDPDRPKPGKPERYLEEGTDHVDPAFSPDGHWLAYASAESTIVQVFVRPFPLGASGGKWQISTAGGRFPVWSRNGRELFYLGVDNRIMVAGYTAKGESFVPDKPRQWSETAIARTGGLWSFDLAPDGKRFVVFPAQGAQADSKAPVHVTVLLNFFDELRRKMPAK